VLVGALTTGDFLLWNWSLSANHDVLALIAGVTLLPLAAASVLLAALTVAQLASRLTRRYATTVVPRKRTWAGAYLRVRRHAPKQIYRSIVRRTARAHALEHPLKLDDAAFPPSAAAARSAKSRRKLAA
jgi:hypothetical protein